MPTGITSTSPTQALPDTSAPEKTFGFPDVQPNQVSAPAPSPLPVPHVATSSIQFQSTTDHDSDANTTVPQSGEAEDEYTLSAYGDISLSEVILPPLPDPTPSGPSPLRPRIPQPRLRLKVQRPPMPKRRPSHYVPDPMPRSGGLNPDERWPGSPRPIDSRSSWVQHQPLVSPLLVDPVNSRTRGNKAVKKSGSSLEKLFDDLLPHSPSIRLSPPGSPANQALGLPQETHEQKSGVQQGRNLPEADAAAKVPQSLPAPAARQDKPKPALWRTRLPPRLPIPKWDM